MELPRRSCDDVFWPDGCHTKLIGSLRESHGIHEWSSVIAYPFDNRTRLMPFRWLDKRVVPCGARSIATTLLECGFSSTRLVLQQWNPRFSPSATVRAGHPIDLLLISSMGLHADEAYRMIRDAHRLGPDRPLILMGGPKAIYEPEDAFGSGIESAGDSADVAVTGEEYILLELLQLLADHALPGEHPLDVFRRAREARLLDGILGLVYRDPKSDDNEPRLIHTGVQRLVRDLDELPMPLAGFTCVERPSRSKTLAPEPMSLNEVRRRSFLAALSVTHGCHFNCDFCPIPAYQQSTWRHKSPERVAGEIKQLGEAMGFRYFFGTDDNFFSNRDSAEAILGAMATSNINGRPFRDCIHFLTEATVFDAYKNRDLLPLAREAGLQTLYLGIEDLSGTLIKKGQTDGRVDELFRELHQNQMEAYGMLIHHDDQPFWSKDPKRMGIANQASRLFELEAVGFHSTYITPSMGARNVEIMFDAGQVLDRVGSKQVPEAFFDGNHVIATRHRHVWLRQLQLAGAYLAFYNPINFLKTLARDLRNPHNRRRMKWQIVGASMIPISFLKLLPFTLSLAMRRVQKHKATPAKALPLFDVRTGERIQWGIHGDIPIQQEYADIAEATKDDSVVADDRTAQKTASEKDECRRNLVTLRDP